MEFQFLYSIIIDLTRNIENRSYTVLRMEVKVKMNLDQALKQIEELKAELALSEKKLISEQKRLREIIGAWRRKAEGKGIFKEEIREGYNAVSGMHYKTYTISLPADLPIEEILSYLKTESLPNLYPYVFKKIDYLPRSKAWAFEVEMDLNYDIRLEEAFIKQYYEEHF